MGQKSFKIEICLLVNQHCCKLAMQIGKICRAITSGNVKNRIITGVVIIGRPKPMVPFIKLPKNTEIIAYTKGTNSMSINFITQKIFGTLL